MQTPGPTPRPRLTPAEIERIVRGEAAAPSWCGDCAGPGPQPRPGDPGLYFALGMLAMLAIDVIFTALMKALS